MEIFSYIIPNVENNMGIFPHNIPKVENNNLGIFPISPKLRITWECFLVTLPK